MPDIVTTYLACWNETDPQARRALIAEHWADDARYVDPLADACGHAAIDATVAAVQGQFPGFVFTEVSPADAHHDAARFSWGLGPAGGDPLVIGFDVLVTDADGRIETVVGFLDKVPA
jgi:SnoaL-like domain